MSGIRIRCPARLIGGSERSESALLQSDQQREPSSLRFPLDLQSRLGRMEQRVAGGMTDAGEKLTGALFY